MKTDEANVPANRPEIEIFDHTGTGGDTAEGLRRLAEKTVDQCLACTGSRTDVVLPKLETVEVSLVSDATIASVHDQFMSDPTPTDVITFEHGEILISLETAARSAIEHGHSPDRETLLYLVHGLLHLNGFDDRNEEARTEMEATQERILGAISPFREAENPG